VQQQESSPAPVRAQPLEVHSAGSVLVLRPDRPHTIGRDPDGDVVLADPGVSWRHARLQAGDGGWRLEDLDSTNGTYADGVPVRQLAVGAGTVVTFGAVDGPRIVLRHPPAGSGDDPARQWLGADRPAGADLPAPTGAFRRAVSVRPLSPRSLMIGRGADNDLVVDDLMASRRHAEFRSHPDGHHEIIDLGSHNGTYLNGQPVERAPVVPGDIVGVGHSAFCLVDGELHEFVDSGEVSLTVEGLTVRVEEGHGRTLLDAVSFPVAERSLLAVAGPSGAGKSTLLGALTGLRPAQAGTVRYDGRDLYREYAELRRRVGLVPQDDVLHTQLTVRQALRYAAELRFPADTARGEREDRVEEVIDELGLSGRGDQVVASLSGGQRKRVSVALELLTKPSLLLLDEPTSGLDPGRDRSVMRMLRDLADDGRTVIVVSHSVLSLDLCDRILLLAPGGRIAFYGPPAEALPFLGYANWPEAFEAFETDPERDWAGRYRASVHHRRYIDEVMGRPAPAAPQPGPAAAPRRARGRLGQLTTLIRRYLRVLSTDRFFLIVMVLLPVITGLLTRALAAPSLGPGHALNTLLILCVGGVLSGAANAVRELVKERPVYRRERMAGLSRLAYLGSKIAVLGVVTAAQAVTLTMVGLYGVTLRVQGGSGVFLPPLAEISCAVALLSLCSMAFGLLISAVAPKEEVSMPLLVLLAVLQIVFSGALLQLNGMPGLEQAAWLVPARWALAAMASTIGLHDIVPFAFATDPLFRHQPATWGLDMGMMALLLLVAALAAARAQRRHEPVAPRRR
jgi:ABC-type multidrug transport system ATPase subunit/pSer/pThr/pTyr-binding forkhead associated (FHA) protein